MPCGFLATFEFRYFRGVSASYSLYHTDYIQSCEFVCAKLIDFWTSFTSSHYKCVYLPRDIVHGNVIAHSKPPRDFRSLFSLRLLDNSTHQQHNSELNWCDDPRIEIDVLRLHAYFKLSAFISKRVPGNFQLHSITYCHSFNADVVNACCFWYSHIT